GRDTASLGDDALPLSADLRLGLGDALAAQLLTDALLGLAAGGPLGGFPLLALADHVLHTGKVLVGPHRPPLAVRVVNAAELLDDGEDVVGTAGDLDPAALRLDGLALVDPLLRSQADLDDLGLLGGADPQGAFGGVPL